MNISQFGGKFICRICAELHMQIFGSYEHHNFFVMQIVSQKYVLHLLKKRVKLMSDAFQHYVYLFF